MANTIITMESLSQQQGDDLVFLDENQEADHWEFINQSDADSDTESLLSIENGFVSWRILTPDSDSPITHQEIETLEPIIQEQDYPVEALFLINDNHEEDLDLDHDRDDDDGDEGGYGLDDELVPWDVCEKLGRQRMRKLGKRGFSKMGNSKRNALLHVKPGAVFGKHGWGIKA